MAPTRSFEHIVPVINTCYIFGGIGVRGFKQLYSCLKPIFETLYFRRYWS